MVKRIQELFKQIFLSLWNSGGLIGRFIALPIGFIFIVILIIFYLFKLTFTWASKLLKLFLDESIYFTNKCASAVNDANEILDEFIQHRVCYYIKKMWSKIVDEDFVETKIALSKNWFWRSLKYLFQIVLWALATILLFLMTFSGIYFISTFFFEGFSVDFRISILLQFLVFTPVIVRIFRQRTINIFSLEFWETERLPTLNFKKRHLLYVVLLLVALVAIYLVSQKKLINFDFLSRTEKTNTEQVVEPNTDTEIDYSDGPIEKDEKSEEIIEVPEEEEENVNEVEGFDENDDIDDTVDLETKNRIFIEKYLTAIDKKDWGTLKDMFADQNITFYENRFDKDELETFIKRIWESVESEKNELEAKTFTVTEINNQRKISFKVQYSGSYTNGKSKKLNPEYKIVLNKNGKIISVKS